MLRVKNKNIKIFITVNSYSKYDSFNYTKDFYHSSFESNYFYGTLKLDTVNNIDRFIFIIKEDKITL